MGAKINVERLCNFCHEVSSIEITNEQYEQVESGMPLIQVKPPLTSFEREFFITGMCPKCCEKIFNIPTKEHEAEWGDFVKTCDCCDCRLYEKDIKAGHCPSCHEKIEQ